MYIKNRTVKNGIQIKTESSQKVKHKSPQKTKKCSTSLFAREMNIKLLCDFILIPVRINKTSDISFC